MVASCPVAKPSIELPELDALVLENVLLRRQILKLELQKLESEERELHRALSVKLGLSGDCSVDLSARRVYMASTGE